ncbi:HAMP domain-containing histidine kinase, partial [Candidatus Falkowbacteria bacterium]|nr:HAMP domain-containing histidine kinase [Candidatus Falkowbacteria bacterium]
PYSNEDLNFLRVLAGQAGVSFENAKLYDEQKQFTVKLQQEVDRATTELRAANKELKKLDQAKSEFISIASHQLRTPMTVIKGYMSMMEGGDFGAVPDKMNKPVHSVLESANRLLALIEDLLNISRIESGRLQYEYEKANLGEMVASVFDELSNHAKRKGLEFRYVPPKVAIPDIIMDPKKIREVVMNLADNAIKYTDKGFVELHLEYKNNEVKYYVKDSGRGLSKEDVGKLFKKFSRVGSAQLVHTEGTGLGLYIAKQIIRKHGGKIWAESPGVGEGSTFALALKTSNPDVTKEYELQQKTMSATKKELHDDRTDTIDTSRIRKSGVRSK